MARIAGLAALVVLSLSAAATAAAKVTPVRQLHITISGSQKVATPVGKGRYLALPYKNAPSRQALIRASRADTTIQTATYGVTAGQDGNHYNFTTVGGDVTAGSSTTNISAQVIPAIITFTPTGDVYDATSVNPACGETVSPLTGVLTGPILNSRRWYAGHTYLGHTQYTDALQRGEFWGNTNPHGSSPNYHVLLQGSNTLNAASSVNAPEVSPGTCSNLGEIDMGAFDAAVQQFLNGIGATTLPIFLVKNVVFTQNNGATCCVLGYHSAFTDSSGNTQTYAVANYITDGQFGTSSDLTATSHEVAEWANDPFVNNATPSWGHLGQVPGCQSNLEVGDPLTGTNFAIPPPTVGGGPTYHVQEEAFAGWFYDAAFGVNGWYSMRGTFTSGATLCQ